MDIIIVKASDEDTQTFPAIYHNVTGTFDAVYSKWTYYRGFATEDEARAWLEARI